MDYTIEQWREIARGERPIDDDVSESVEGWSTGPAGILYPAVMQDMGAGPLDAKLTEYGLEFCTAVSHLDEPNEPFDPDRASSWLQKIEEWTPDRKDEERHVGDFEERDFT